MNLSNLFEYYLVHSYQLIFFEWDQELNYQILESFCMVIFDQQ